MKALDTKVERLEDNKVKVTVTIPGETIGELFAAAYKHTSKTQKVPGFRAGKAPRNVLDNVFGKEYFQGMVTDTAVNELSIRGVDDADVIFLSEPEWGDIEGAEDGKDFTVAVTGEVKPELELSSYDPVEIELPKVEATEEEINSQIDYMREYSAEYVDVDRAAKAGDTVFCDLECSLNGEDLAGLSGENRPCELGADLMPEEFDANLMGAKAGQDLEFDFKVADDPLEVVKEADIIHVKAHVQRVTVKQLPEVTDEWVKESCGYESVEELNKRIAGSIVSQKTDMLPRIKEAAVSSALADRLIGEPTEAFLEEAKTDLYRQFFYQLQQQNMSLEQYCLNQAIAPEQLKEDLEAQAVERAKANLAVDALARYMGYTAGPDEIRAEFNASGAEDPAALQEQWRKEGRLALIREGILRTRATDWAMNTAVVKYAEAGAEKKAEKKPAKKAEKKAADKSTKSCGCKKDAGDCGDLSKMTVAQLKELAAEKGIELKSGAKKVDIIAALEV